MSDAHSNDPAGWVDRHGDSLYRYALSRLRAPDLAADVVQETFLEAFRGRGKFERRSSERTWLVGILKHKIVDHFRRSGRDDGTGRWARPEEGRAEFDRRGRWNVPPAAWAGDPSREIESREFWEVFGGCLAKLPKGLADAFLLRELDGLSTEEIGERLGITPANLWTRLHRGRSLLRGCLEKGWFGQPKSPRSTVVEVDPRPDARLRAEMKGSSPS
jgi:RNA polymerase sigma-70 factor (TIGR02943 family)